MRIVAARLDGREVAAARGSELDPRRLDPVPRGLYETVLVRHGRPVLAAAHAARLAASCRALGLGPVDPAGLVGEMRALGARARSPRARLRVLRWREGEPRTLLTVSPEPPAPREVVLGISEERRPRDADARRHKRIDAPDLDRARRRFGEGGRFDDLILDDRETVLEGARTSVFWRAGRTLYTPAATLPILPGTRRAWLMQAASRRGLAVVEVEAPVDALRSADEVLVTNAIVGVRRRARLAP